MFMPDKTIMLNEVIEKQINSSAKPIYAGSLQFNIIGDQKIVLENAIKLAFLGYVGATHYKISVKDNIPYLAFYCTSSSKVEDAIPLPMLHDSVQCTEIAYKWISNLEFSKNKFIEGFYSGDGSLKEGFQICDDPFKTYDYRLICVVKPHYTYYGK